MNLLPDEDQTQIADSLVSFLAGQVPVSRFRPPAPQIGNQDARYWPQLGELGFLGISIAERDGGIGLGAAEEMLAYREFGRHLLSPALLGITLAARVAAHARLPLLSDILAGHVSVGLANPRGKSRIGEQSEGEFHLIDSASADWVFTCDAGGAALYARRDFSEIASVHSTDNSLSLERARLDHKKAAAWIPASADAIYSRALVLIGAYAVGLAEATRDMAVNYAQTRVQFGKPIGSFQAIKHICADMAIRAEAALCEASYAALALAESPASADFHATACKLVTTDAALKNAGQNIQVHGAIGFTAEADAHVYLKRAHVMDQLWGDTRAQRERMLAFDFPG